MAQQIMARSIIKGEPVETLKDIVNELELGLVTVQDVVDRNCDGAPPEDSYIGVNLGLYVQYTETLLLKLRSLLREGHSIDVKD